jgi:hypothetical protein
VRYVFYESESDDATLAMLRAFVAERDGEVLTERGVAGERTERIARGRNAVVARAEALLEAGGFDFFVNLDLDDRCAFDVASVVECLARAGEWDVATASQTREYYDKWALRTDAAGDAYAGAPHCVVGYAHRAGAGAARCAPLPPLEAWFPDRPELRGRRTFPRGGGYYRVRSAFGGLAVYRGAVLLRARDIWRMPLASK